MADYSINLTGNTINLELATSSVNLEIATSGPQGAAGPSGTVESNSGMTVGGELTVTGDIFHSGTSFYSDNKGAFFGNSLDLRIFHNGTDNYVDVNGVGDLYLRTQANDKDVIIQSDNGLNGVTTYFRADGSTGQSQLFHYGSQKLNTTSSGVNIDGTLTSDGLTVDGSVDISGNLLVGKTSTSTAINGVGLYSYGMLHANRVGGRALTLDREGTNGELALFRKDGSTVGTIGTRNGSSIEVTSPANVEFKAFADTTPKTIYYSGTHFSPFLEDDASIDFGRYNRRWKDLYLSGGVYLGGTGSANKMDDYETGSPTLAVGTGYGNAPSSGWSVTDQSYVKVGDLVTIRAIISNSSTNNVAVDDRFLISSLPFVGDTGGTVQTAGTAWVYGQISSGNNAFGYVALSTNGAEAWVYITHEDGVVQYDDFISVNFSYHI